jgi:hypothetical protein
MTATYRLVHFVPDPFVESRVPIAALVTHNGSLSVVRAKSVPSARCLGGNRQAAVVQMMLEDLSHAGAGARLPSTLGPQAVLGDERAVPPAVADPLQWVARLVQHTSDDDPKDTAYRGPHRATQGYRFFQTYGVSQFVRKSFDAALHANGHLARAKRFGNVSHYVEGSSDLLLMEPIVTTRDNLETELSDVATLFGAYRSVIQQQQNAPKKPQLVAYVLDGGSAEARMHAMMELRDHADRVVDTANEPARAALIGQIKSIAATDPGPLLS